MNEIEGLLKAYQHRISQPWDRSLAGPQRVWFAIYDPTQERRLRLRLPEFALATKDTGRGWHELDLTNLFAEWMASHEYREAYFEEPEDMDLALQDFTNHVIHHVRQHLTAPDVDTNTVVAVVGLASLFGLTRASTVFDAVASVIRGRLLVFFPGQKEGSNYRLLDARDGWNYVAIAISATEGRGT